VAYQGYGSGSAVPVQRRPECLRRQQQGPLRRPGVGQRVQYHEAVGDPLEAVRGARHPRVPQGVRLGGEDQRRGQTGQLLGGRPGRGRGDLRPPGGLSPARHHELRDEHLHDLAELVAGFTADGGHAAVRVGP
jgi:hypothetical protein